MTRTPARRRAATALASLTVVLSLGLTACGGDDETADATDATSETPEATPDETETSGPNGGDTGISKEDFLEQANAICDAGNAELAAAGAALDPGDAKALAEYATGVLVPNIEKQLSEIRDLGFPEGDGEMLGSVFDQASAALSEIVDDPSVLAADGGPFVKVNEALTEYGLTSCGS